MVVTETRHCLDEAPPVLDRAEIPPCHEVVGETVCPPISAEAERAIESFIRRARYWMAAAWHDCGTVTPPP